MSSSSCLCPLQESVYAGHVCAGEDLCVGDSFLPFNFHWLAETSCVEVVQLSGMFTEDGPNFTGVKECIYNYNLVDLKLGAKADAPTLPDDGLTSPKRAADLGDAALDFLVDVRLTGQGASQVSEFIHIIDHFTLH